MESQRAKAIRQSQDLIKVTYQGNPVYIQEIDEQNGTAQVYVLEDPSRQQNVAIEQLQES
ncbi:H-type small acid-soluble spore protein [Sediminibacillus dalangtanensis]|uniref:Small, acid-soluble spore protein H n=1 Tax=Sediminibacillus dalangtanensis TaxID=2729421 RepID=A0ABX7VQU1_9BACI|nr:H-type small acid-soluble spore protein [Sediminibacillus dalangtanensis]QTM98868.1 H-type small acid-soluble spore protein [Sediminibacillus dalangtanensis]